MGRVKEFAFWLTDCVYYSNMSDAQIISTFKKSLAEDDSQDDTDHWLREQIEAVRDNPEIYRGMVE